MDIDNNGLYVFLWSNGKTILKLDRADNNICWNIIYLFNRMWSEATIITLALWAYGFWRYRKWLKNYFKNWWFMMKMSWKGDRK